MTGRDEARRVIARDDRVDEGSRQLPRTLGVWPAPDPDRGQRADVIAGSISHQQCVHVGLDVAPNLGRCDHLPHHPAQRFEALAFW